MHDDLTAHDGREEVNRSRVPEPPKAGDIGSKRPAADGSRMADREVPIELTRTPDMVHAWLDGEIPESSVRGTEAVRHIEFWKHLDSDLETRRLMHAPVGLAERIMAALPATAPRAVAPWWHRPIEMNPLAVAAAAAGLLALGTAIGASMKVR
jgi:hypothetical protein